MKKQFVAFLLGLFSYSPALAEPFTPKDDSFVIENLPVVSLPGRGGEKSIGQLRKESEKIDGVKNPLATFRFVKENIELSRSSGDPRYLGIAERAIDPLFQMNPPPSEAFVLRGVLRQSNHDFEGSLIDLDVALKSRPDDTQSLLSKASILTVLGRFADAEKTCRDLVNAESTVQLCCSALPRALTGSAPIVTEELWQAIAELPASSPYLSWTLSLRGEVEEIDGKLSDAEESYRLALKIAPTDLYTKSSLADLLLRQDKPEIVISLLSGTLSDNLLLRRTIAEKLTHDPNFESSKQFLLRQIEVSDRRGDKVHLREQAIFYLKVMEEPLVALDRARLNWGIQKESIDAQIFLESAKAAGSVVDTAAVKAWMRSSSVSDSRLSGY